MNTMRSLLCSRDSNKSEFKITYYDDQFPMTKFCQYEFQSIHISIVIELILVSVFSALPFSCHNGNGISSPQSYFIQKDAMRREKI